MPSVRSILPFVAAMTIVVAASNYLVRFPVQFFGLEEILTWGAFTYPVAFLINDLTNRRFGPSAARLVVGAGFVLAVVLSVVIASPRIAIASGTAFLIAQLLDISIFDALRRQAWWRAPLISSLAGSVIDTLIFFSLAFAAYFAFLDTAFGLDDGSLAFPVSWLGTEMPLWVSLAVGDFWVKVLVGLAMLAPYGVMLSVLKPAEAVR